MPIVNDAEVDEQTVERSETRFTRAPLSRAAAEDGDPALGCSRYELSPDGKAWPYHYHVGNAEAMYVLEGSGVVRLDDDEYPIRADDYVAFPPGEAGAHRVINDSDAPLRYLMFSTMTDPDVTVYPDSEKFGVYAGAPPGGREERTLEGYYPIDGDVSYWAGEED